MPKTFDQIASLQPDMILLDLAITHKAGWELLEHLHTEVDTQKIPVLITSTDRHLLDRAQNDVQRYGRNRYIVKPLDIEELLRTIPELVGLASSGRRRTRPNRG